MLQSNFIKIVLRSIPKNFGNPLLNLSGLAVSIAACLLIMMFVFHEQNFDYPVLYGDPTSGIEEPYTVV